jgi:bromodomain adjacent to zinc finger domain protein 1A
MPLLRRQAFAKQKPPPDLKADEEVFFCQLTGEIFRDYE